MIGSAALTFVLISLVFFLPDGLILFDFLVAMCGRLLLGNDE
jgi:hypothetical protein